MAGSPRSNGRPRARHQPSESQVANGRAWWRAEGERIWVEAVTGQSGQREAVLRSRRLKTVVTVSAGCVAAVAGVSGLGELLGPTPAGILALLAAGLSA